MYKKRRNCNLKLLFGLLTAFVLTIAVAGMQLIAAESAHEETLVDYSADRPLLMKGKSLERAAQSVDAGNLKELKTALNGSAAEIYITNKITITEDLDIPSGKLILRGYNCCYGTMFEIPSGKTVTVSSEIDASGDQIKLYTGPVFDIMAGGKLQILSGSIYGSVSENDGGAIVNRGILDIKGGSLQGHTSVKRGGAIYNEGTLTITGGQLLDNRVMAKADVNMGGAIYNAKGASLNLNGGIIRSNFSLVNGGAIYNEGSITVQRGQIGNNKAQKTGNGIYSTEDVVYTGSYYVNQDEVISQKNIIVNYSGFENASVIKAQGFLAEKKTVNQSGGKLTCAAMSGDMENDGHIYYNGDGIFTGKVEGSGQFHTSKTLTIDAPGFASHLTVDKGNVILTNADMVKHDISVSAGSCITSGGSGSVKVRNITLRGGTYMVENASLDTNAGLPTDCKYLDAEKIQCSSESKLTIKFNNDPAFNGKEAYYVPIGKRVSINQTDVNAIVLKDSSGNEVRDGGKHKRSLLQQSGVTYMKWDPAAAYDLKVIFQDADGKQQKFFEGGQEKVRVYLGTESGYLASALRLSDEEGFLTEGSGNYGGYRFTSVPAGKTTVSADFTDRNYRSLRGTIDLKKDDTLVLHPQELGNNPEGKWWTDEGNYSADKYVEIKNTMNWGTKITISNAGELAAIAKIVSDPREGDSPKKLSGIIFELTNDIDLNGFQWRPIGTKDYNTWFYGILDGKGHTIKNMSIGYPDMDKSLEYAGLFGWCGSTSEIRNVTLSDYTMRLQPTLENGRFGGLVGLMSGKMENCHAINGNIEMDVLLNAYVGGLAGNLGIDSVVNKCSVSGLNLVITESATGKGSQKFIGGFVGTSSGTLTNCKIEDSRIESCLTVGGFAFWLGNTTNCFSDVTIIGKGKIASIGGFTNLQSSGVIKNCYSKGNISTPGAAGGFVYHMSNGSDKPNEPEISNCYTTCNISGRNVAGFAYGITEGTIKNSYASGNLTCFAEGNPVLDYNMSGFLHTGINKGGGLVQNCYFTGKMSNEAITGTSTSSEGGFNYLNANTNQIKFQDNYTLADITHKGKGEAGGFSYSRPSGDSYINNYYYSNIGKASADNFNDGIYRMVEPDQSMTGRQLPVTYTVHKDDLPGGAKVTAFRFDDNIPGAAIKKTADNTYEVTPTIDFGVLHLTGEMTASNAKLSQPLGDVPEGWDFKVSPADTTMKISEDLIVCRIDYDNEEILTPNIQDLKKSNASGTLDTENDQIKFKLLEGDFGNLIPFASPKLQSSMFIPARPKVPVVKSMISGDKKLLVFATNKENSIYIDGENDIRPDTGYEYSIDGGKSYQKVTSSPDGKVLIKLTAGTFGNFQGITDASGIKDARLRLAATESSFRSKAMADETGSEVVPPEVPKDDEFQVTYYMNDGTNKIYHMDMTVDGKVQAPKQPDRTGFTFKGWYTERTANAGVFDFSQKLTANIKLYAHWEAVTYTIQTKADVEQGVEHLVYAVSEDRADATDKGSYTEGTRIVLEASPASELYTFLYWKEGDQIVSEKPIFEMTVTKDQTFTACFKNNKPVPEVPMEPVYLWYSHCEIGIKTIEGQEYAIRKSGDPDYGSWQTGSIFTGLESFTDYQIVTRKIENDSWAASQISKPLELRTLKSVSTEEPDPPMLNSIGQDKTSIRIETRAGEEYAIRRKGGTVYGPWQTGGVFTGLQPKTTYQIVCREAAIPGVQAAGTVSQPLEVTIPDNQPDNPPEDQPDNPPEIAARYTVTFMDGSTVLEIKTVESGKPAAAPVIQKAGYQLSWSIPYDNVTSDLIVRAVWKPNTYIISFQGNKGKLKGDSRKNAVFGTAYGKLPRAERKGYQFNGWFTKKSGGAKITEATQVNILADTIYYAQWSKITLKKPNLKSVKNTSGKKAVVAWSKMSGVDGYRIEYSTASKFTKKTTKSVKVSASGKSKPTKTLSRLKKGKTYYIRIAAYKKDSVGKTLYGLNSKVKKVIIKK